MATDSRPPRRAARIPRAFLLALLAILAVYLAGAARIASARSVWSPDNGARLIQVQSVLRHWPDWQIAYPAKALDPEHRNSPLVSMSSAFEFHHEGRVYIFYSFLFALLSAAFFQLFGYFGLAIPSLIGGIGTALATYGLARLLRLRYPVAPMLLVALATPLILYSIVFWDHSLTTGIAALSFYLTVRATLTGECWPWFAAGAALGAGLWFHEILIPCLPGLTVGAWWARRRWPWLPRVALLAGGAALLIVPLALINNAVYGTPAGPHLSNNQLGSAQSIGQFLLRPGEWLPGAFYTLFGWGNANPAYTWQLREWIGSLPLVRWEMKVSLWMALPFLAWLPLALTGLWRRAWVLSLLLFAGMLAAGFWVTRRIEWPHSLFYAAPWLALAFAATRRRAKSTGEPVDDEGRLPWQFLAIATGVYTAVALLKPTLGGTEWGARYLLIALPALTLFSWGVAERLLLERQRGAKPLLAGMALLLAMTLWIQAHGFGIIHGMHQRNRQLADALARSRDDVVISTVWWAPLNAAPVYGQKQILYAGDPAHHPTPLFRRMRERGIESYTLIGFSPWDISAFAAPEGFVPLLGSERRLPFDLWAMRYIVPVE